MYDRSELKQRLVIIKNSDLVDAKILDENYKRLCWRADDQEEKKQFEILRIKVKKRIDELTKQDSQIGNVRETAGEV